MSRLIDADTLPALFDEEYKKTRKLIEEGESHLDNLAEGFLEAHQVILKMSTIEAVPVVHGEWITDKNGVTYCNKCRRIDDYASVHYYCPNCGAKMEGGDAK